MAGHKGAMRLWLILPLLLAACDKPAPKPKPKPRETPNYSYPLVNPAAQEAAEVLRLYYGRIEAGDYDAAYAMRTAGGADKARFVANFRAYESYHAQLGAAGGPAVQGPFEFVEVPVMTTGRFVGGKPFGTSGRVMLRRARGGRDRHWYVLAQ
jgi:hypothetical protein